MSLFSRSSSTPPPPAAPAAGAAGGAPIGPPAMTPHDTRGPQTFLPEDFIERRAERRTSIISAALFAVVTIGVIGAFFITNRQWNDVSRYQQAINVRYAQAAKDIEQLKILETQKHELLDKAELTTVLIEKVPRSILLAELINRMPSDLTMLELQMKSTRLDGPKGKKIGRGTAKPPAIGDKKDAGKGKGKASSMSGNKKGRASKDGAVEEEKPEITAPRMQTAIILIGVAPSHTSVAKYVTGLQSCGLLEKVELRFSEVTIIRDVAMNKFRIEASLREEADARRLEAAQNPKLGPAPETVINAGAEHPLADAPTDGAAGAKEDR